MKKLVVDIEDIAEMMEMAHFESRGYLDLETGKTVLLPAEMVDLEEQDFEELSDVPEWEKDLLPIARAIAEGSDRYEAIPDVETSEAYDDMARFAGTVTDADLRGRLEHALHGKGAFQRFKRTLERSADERERWFEFKAEAMAERVRDWLRWLEIEPVEGKSEE